MNLKLIVAIFVIAAVPVCAQAQTPGEAKVTKANAQRVVKMISGDKAKTQTYCDIGKVGKQIVIEEADQKKDAKRTDELHQKIFELATKLGPEFIALGDGIRYINPNSPDGQEIQSMFTTLDKLCAK